MTTHPLQATRTACAVVLSTAITAAIFGVVIVLPAQAEPPPILPAPATSDSVLTRQVAPASTPRALHRQPLVKRITSSNPAPVGDVVTRELTPEGDILQRRSFLSPSGDTTLETQSVLRRHDNRVMGDQRTGAPGVNYGPSRERSLQGRTSDSPITVESSGFSFKRRID